MFVEETLLQHEKDTNHIQDNGVG